MRLSIFTDETGFDLEKAISTRWKNSQTVSLKR